MIDLINIATQEKKIQPVLSDSTNEDIQYLKTKYPDKILFDMETVATELNLSYEYIRRCVIKEKIKVTKYGSRKMIHRNEFAKIITEGL